jgi:hypothetical protein
VFNITIDEIKDVLLNLNLGKAVGNDKISHNMLRHTASTVEQKNVFRRLALSSSFTTNSPVATFCKGDIGDEVDLPISFLTRLQYDLGLDFRVVVGLSQSKIISTISSFSSDNQNNHT